MMIQSYEAPLQWGALDIGIIGLAKSWHGESLDKPVGFALAMDKENLWFVVTRSQPAVIHPDAQPGKFTADLWKYDVAELFFADPVSGRYIEFNLASNGAWWQAEFVAPRIRDRMEDIVMPGVHTFADSSESGTWVAAMAVPLDMLRARVGFGPETKANVSFVVNSPDPVHLSANELAGEVPDFHQPRKFSRIEVVDGKAVFAR